jgi:hypothetical protein
MKNTCLTLLAVHGLLHVLGFLTAFHWIDEAVFSMSVSQPLGLLWLFCALLIFVFGLCYFKDNKYAWLVGFVAVLLSQGLIISCWSDAKFGTLPNVFMAGLCLFSYASFRFDRRIGRERQHLLSKVSLKTLKIIDEKDIEPLPLPVQKWLKTTGILGKPELKSARIAQLLKLKMKPNQKKWFSATAVQHTTTEPPSFLWVVAMELLPSVTITGCDSFVEGKGTMKMKLNSLLPIVNEKGIKLDEGTMQRFLGELVWLPSLALSPYIVWEEIDAFTAKATLQYKGSSGSGLFYFDAMGDFKKFVALRFKENKATAKRYPWVLTVDDYASFDGIRIPSKMKATWQLEEGEWTWLQLEIVALQYNTIEADGSPSKTEH